MPQPNLARPVLGRTRSTSDAVASRTVVQAYGMGLSGSMCVSGTDVAYEIVALAF